MKKFFSFAIVVAAAAMVSCAGTSTKPAEAEVVETEVVTEAAAVDTTACAAACDSTACDKAADGACCQK